ncbi:unnamed protein product [marine sediment metagenome]|uniref:Uncharacterized protein n=1 Tax=marine sediment metagenome TaxID=412755 RepID=X0YCS0_9ZZZZ
MAATNLGQLSVDIVANIGNLQRGLNNAAQLINRFTKQASRGAQTLGTGFQKTSQQVQTGAKFMGSQYNKFAVGVKESSAKVARAVGTVDAPKFVIAVSNSTIAAAPALIQPRASHIKRQVANQVRLNFIHFPIPPIIPVILVLVVYV